MWDVTCIDTFAPSYRSLAVQGPGTVAARAESLKEEKYIDLLRTHEFAPIAVETSGVFGPRTLAFVKELGRRLRSHTEEKACTYLIQRMSMCSEETQSPFKGTSGATGILDFIRWLLLLFYCIITLID